MRRRGRTVRERVVAPTGHKYCPGCQQSLPLDHWHRNAAVRDGLASYCKTCRRKQSRVGHLKSAFGLTPEEHQALLEQQGGRCVICGATPPTHTDHDHSTGAVRGLLCGPCNMGLGQFRDDPALLEAAADYLRERQPTDDVVRRRLHEIFPPAPAA
ncbi:MAG: endonuclease VII domain-containing protein [Frankiales bacterium]|nr:endonuclease VII domain-containing protein [Frankiales bacterium]